MYFLLIFVVKCDLMKMPDNEDEVDLTFKYKRNRTSERLGVSPNLPTSSSARPTHLYGLFCF